MKPKFIHILRCPVTYKPLLLKVKNLVNGRVKEGLLIEPHSGNVYPITKYIPRFIQGNNYTTNFDFEWAIHHTTQYDNEKYRVTQDRFQKETCWPNNLRGETILEIGCGAGRFTKEALKTKALVVSFDYSTSVNMNYFHNGQADNLLIVQADIYAMPFKKNFFNKAFCFGVLQHTPRPEKAFLNILKYIKSEGQLVSDIYLKNLARYYLEPKYWVRPLTRGRNPEKLYPLVTQYINFMWPLARLIRKIPSIGPTLNWKMLIADHSRDLPKASENMLKEWAYLDTMDMLSPLYDNPQTLRGFRKWHTRGKLKSIYVQRGYNGIVGRGIK